MKTEHPLALAPALMDDPVLRYFTFSRSVLGHLNIILPVLSRGYAPYDLDLRARRKGLQKTDTFKHILVLQLAHGEPWLEHCMRAGRASECVPPPPNSPPPGFPCSYAFDIPRS